MTTNEENYVKTKSGFVALIGASNAGKSTLVNQFVDAKVSIVSHKVQTTRAIVRGIVIYEKSQIVFLDTPGIFQPKRRLDRAMVSSAWCGARDADFILFMVDCQKGFHGGADKILENLKDVKQPKWLILNKIDQVKPEKLLELSQQANDAVDFDETFMISASKGLGSEKILKALNEKLPDGPWYYPEDQISDLPLRQLAAEITREKIYHRLHQELPYASHVETETWEERRDGSVRIEQVIYVERDSQKKIVIGKNGETIKAIGKSARLEFADILERKVHLILFVKVRENWIHDPERYREMGLDFHD